MVTRVQWGGLLDALSGPASGLHEKLVRSLGHGTQLGRGALARNWVMAEHQWAASEAGAQVGHGLLSPGPVHPHRLATLQRHYRCAPPPNTPTPPASAEFTLVALAQASRGSGARSGRCI